MHKFRLITLYIALSFAFAVQGQSRQHAEDTYKDANAYFYFEDYEEALALYQSIYNEFPDNANLDYRMGLCYLTIVGSKHKAIEHLERASKNVSRRYNQNSIREVRAPIDAIFYLGNAYFSNNQLDKALEAYEQFRSQIRRERQYDMAYLNHQIEAVRKSRVVQNYPVNFLRSNLGALINNRFPNFNPVISGDGNTLAYTTRERFYQAIMVARKVGKSWGKPANITLDLVVDGNCSTLSLSYDGNELYLFKDDNHVGNIYVSNFVRGAWTPMRKLNENINTEFYETHASVSADGRKLYFASNRVGGFGELDIWVSEREKGGDWGPAKNLGANVNTRFNENTPFITNDGNMLFFSSDGHHGVGGYDIFFVQRQADGKWQTPVNIGYPINTPDDDLFYQPVDDGAIGLMAVHDPTGFGEKDITQIEIFLPKYQRSIVTTSDFFARKTNLPQRTLVVDTVAVAGVALIDPSKPEHREYIDDDKHFTLFFDGKPYDLRDQSKEIQALRAKLTPIAQRDTIRSLRLAPVTQLEKTTQSSYPYEDFDEQPSDVLAAMDSIMKGPKGVVTIPTNLSKIDTTEVTASLLLQPKPIVSDKEKDILVDIFRRLSRSNNDSLIVDLLLSSWESNPAMYKMQLVDLVLLIDSLGETDAYGAVFAKLIDLVSIKSVEGVYRQSRKIAQTTYDEDFFFRLQRLKRNASPGLVVLFDEAIITQPSISSFSSLLEYLQNLDDDKFMPYTKEFMMLLLESSLNSYFELSDEHQRELHKMVEPKPKPLRLTLVVLLLVSLIVFGLIYLKKQRRG